MKVGKEDEIIKIIITDGRIVWESTKCKSLIYVHTSLTLSLVYWNDLIKLKPDGIEESIQSSAISMAIFGTTNSNDELKGEDLVVEVVETGSGGNLTFSWKLKQSYGITVGKKGSESLKDIYFKYELI